MIYQQPGVELRSVKDAKPDRPIFTRELRRDGLSYGKARVLLVPEPINTAKTNALALKLSDDEFSALRDFFDSELVRVTRWRR